MSGCYDLGAGVSPHAGHTLIRKPAPRATTLDTSLLGRRTFIDPKTLYTSVGVLAILLAHTWVPSELGRCIVGLAPLVFIVLGRRVGSADVSAGSAALLITLLDMLFPLPEHRQFLILGIELHRVVPLFVIGAALFRLRSAQLDLADQSRRDPLTGLLNRRGFEHLAERELVRAARYHRPIAFALIDLDHFKEINDRFGHAEGDAVLRAVATELSSLRAFDLPVRLGGDEFGLLMPETDEDQAQRVVERLEQRLHERLCGGACEIAMSVGIATSGDAAAHPLSQLMEEADRRMYLHKQHHRSSPGLPVEQPT